MSDTQQESPKPGQRRKYKKRTILTPSQWVQVRTLYELGECPLKALSATWGIGFDTIKKRAAKEGWTEKKLAAQVQQKIEKTAIEMFADKGLPKEDLIELLASDAREVKTFKNVKIEAKDKNGKTIYDRKGLPVMIEKTIQVRDNDVTLRTRQEVNRMCGNLAPVKEEINIRATVMTIAINLKAIIMKCLGYVPDDKQGEIIAEFEKALEEPKQEVQKSEL